MPDPVIVPLGLLAKFRPSRRNRQRVEVAKQVHALRRDQMEMSDRELWDRLSDELAEWAHSGVIAQITIDDLSAQVRELDPRQTSNPSQREVARNDLRSSLDELYNLLVTNDAIMRWVRRDVRHATRANLRLLRRRIARRREPPDSLETTPSEELEVGTDQP